MPKKRSDRFDTVEHAAEPKPGIRMGGGGNGSYAALCAIAAVAAVVGLIVSTAGGNPVTGAIFLYLAVALGVGLLFFNAWRNERNRRPDWMEEPHLEAAQRDSH